jgi:hypothetical protein
MRQGAKSKGFVRQNALRMDFTVRNKVLQCLRKFDLAGHLGGFEAVQHIQGCASLPFEADAGAPASASIEATALR